MHRTLLRHEILMKLSELLLVCGEAGVDVGAGRRGRDRGRDRGSASGSDSDSDSGRGWGWDRGGGLATA
jgi:hypothetical protein